MSPETLRSPAAHLHVHVHRDVRRKRYDEQGYAVEFREVLLARHLGDTCVQVRQSQRAMSTVPNERSAAFFPPTE